MLNDTLQQLTNELEILKQDLQKTINNQRDLYKKKDLIISTNDKIGIKFLILQTLNYDLKIKNLQTQIVEKNYLKNTIQFKSFPNNNPNLLEKALTELGNLLKNLYNSLSDNISEVNGNVRLAQSLKDKNLELIKLKDIIIKQKKTIENQRIFKKEIIQFYNSLSDNISEVNGNVSLVQSLKDKNLYLIKLKDIIIKQKKTIENQRIFKKEIIQLLDDLLSGNVFEFYSNIINECKNTNFNSIKLNEIFASVKLQHMDILYEEGPSFMDIINYYSNEKIKILQGLKNDDFRYDKKGVGTIYISADSINCLQQMRQLVIKSYKVNSKIVKIDYITQNDEILDYIFVTQNNGNIELLCNGYYNSLNLCNGNIIPNDILQLISQFVTFNQVSRFTKLVNTIYQDNKVNCFFEFIYNITNKQFDDINFYDKEILLVGAIKSDNTNYCKQFLKEFCYESIETITHLIAQLIKYNKYEWAQEVITCKYEWAQQLQKVMTYEQQNEKEKTLNLLILLPIYYKQTHFLQQNCIKNLNKDEIMILLTYTEMFNAENCYEALVQVINKLPSNSIKGLDSIKLFLDMHKFNPENILFLDNNIVGSMVAFNNKCFSMKENIYTIENTIENHNYNKNVILQSLKTQNNIKDDDHNILLFLNILIDNKIKVSQIKLQHQIENLSMDNLYDKLQVIFSKMNSLIDEKYITIFMRKLEKIKIFRTELHKAIIQDKNVYSYFKLYPNEKYTNMLKSLAVNSVAYSNKIKDVSNNLDNIEDSEGSENVTNSMPQESIEETIDIAGCIVEG